MHEPTGLTTFFFFENSVRICNGCFLKVCYVKNKQQKACISSCLQTKVQITSVHRPHRYLKWKLLIKMPKATTYTPGHI